MKGVWEALRRSPAFALLTLLLLISIALQIASSLSWGHGSFQITEWLINYSGGFVRRGLPGAVLLGASNLLGIGANLLAIIVSLAAYLVLAGWFLIRGTRVFPAALILSCVVMGFPAYQDCIIRKDCLGLLLLLACLKVERSPLPHVARIALVNLIAATSILCHEAFAFYALPALILLPSTQEGPMSLRRLIMRGLSFAPALATFALISKFHGSPPTAQAVNDSLVPLWRAIEPGNTAVAQPSAAIEALGWTSQKGLSLGLSLLTSGFYQPAAWAFVFMVSFALMLWFTSRNESYENALRSKVRVAALLGFQLVCISPLFLLGFDYGRWLFFWVCSSMMLYLHDLNLPAAVESTLLGLAGRSRSCERFVRSQARDWVLLLFGVPVCWNLAGFIFAAPLTRALHTLLPDAFAFSQRFH